MLVALMKAASERPLDSQMTSPQGTPKFGNRLWEGLMEWDAATEEGSEKEERMDSPSRPWGIDSLPKQCEEE